MKKLNFIIAGLALFSFISFSACNSGEESSENDSDTTIVELENKMDDLESGEKDTTAAVEITDVDGKEYTAKYICPDHCKGSGSDMEGECSNCDMEYMENPSHKNE